MQRWFVGQWTCQSISQSSCFVCACDLLLTMCFCQKRTFKSSQRCTVKVKTRGSPLRSDCETRAALHTFNCEAITFSHSSFISPNPFFWHLMKHNPSVRARAVRSSQTVKRAWRWRLFDAVCAWMCVFGAGLKRLIWICELHKKNLKGSTQTPSTPKIQPQSPFLVFKSGFTNTLHCSFRSSVSLSSQSSMISVAYRADIISTISCLGCVATLRWSIFRTQCTSVQIQKTVVLFLPYWAEVFFPLLLSHQLQYNACVPCFVFHCS